jgi:hypothetical protein
MIKKQTIDMKFFARCVGVVAAVIVLQSCSQNSAGSGRAQASPIDVLVSEQLSYRITNPNGSVLIEWDGQHARRFTHNEQTWREAMIVRESPWNGALGVYSAGEKAFSRNGLVHRIVYNEAKRDFESEDELAKFMEVGWNRNSMNLVWDRNGLVGGLVGSPGRGQLNVDLWRFTVRGRVPDRFLDNECSGGQIIAIAE